MIRQEGVSAALTEVFIRSLFKGATPSVANIQQSSFVPRDDGWVAELSNLGIHRFFFRLPPFDRQKWQACRNDLLGARDFRIVTMITHSPSGLTYPQYG